ncbi:Urease accessory protein UreF [hydrothermal vent metagenome]|uniref:Urease accessory protein UreF n=1 Tax=hydrothermal vent metagenome TaxID=652676 RepID=A0A3B0YH86_9ZZZZ
MPGLRLLQLISPTLPTGAFTYSQGLEWAVECGWIRNEQDTRQWLQSVLRDSLQYLELPVLVRLYEAAEIHDTTQFTHWSHWLYASRETSELRDEEKQRARALFTVLGNLPDNDHWPELENWRQAVLTCQLSGYALAACRWHIALTDLLQGYAWSWLENAVAAAVKLVPLGQTEGQRLLYELSREIGGIIEQATTLDDNLIGAGMPALAIASSLHETQYSRLFRS